jgi:oligopeptide/dipeptide ABC transporter ATP-binding protein
MSLLEIRDLRIEFGRGEQARRAVDGVSLSIQSGETLCLVGESGSGKSVTALSIARLLPSPPAQYTGGHVLLDGRDTLKMTTDELRRVRGATVSYVFQDPGAALNPVYRVGSQVKEALKLHRPECASDAEVVRLFKLVGIAAPENRVRSFPHELSGGLQQRVMIAMALASNPKLLIADEPTTALDVTIQAQILDLLKQLKKQFGMAILLITHNLGIAGEIGDRIAVMYAGQIVETAPTSDLLQSPLHPYTRALLESVPQIGSSAASLKAIPGTVPRVGAFPTGCRFHPRCPVVQPICPQKAIDLVEILPARHVRCPFSELIAPATNRAPVAS